MEGISVILLVHNEIKTIQNEIDEWSKLLKDIPSSELILSEDGSNDGTSEYLQTISNDKFVLCQTKYRRGYRRAFIDAVEISKYDYIFLSDTGGKNNLFDFWGFYHRRKEFDLINGIKVRRQDNLTRKMMTKSLNLILRRFFDIKVYDADCGFRLYNRELLVRLIKTKPEFTSFVNLELTLKFILNGFKYTEIPIAYYKREGKSRSLPLKKMPKKIFILLFELLKLKKSNHF